MPSVVTGGAEIALGGLDAPTPTPTWSKVATGTVLRVVYTAGSSGPVATACCLGPNRATPTNTATTTTIAAVAAIAMVNRRRRSAACCCARSWLRRALLARALFATAQP